MAQDADTLAAKLAAAMRAAGLVHEGEPSVRALALRLAGSRSEDSSVVDDYRKQVRRWLNSNPNASVQRRSAELLADALNTTIDYWPMGRAASRSVSAAFNHAEGLVRRLDAGESFPAEDLEAAADAVEFLSEVSHRLAGRLQQAAEGARQTR